MREILTLDAVDCDIASDSLNNKELFRKAANVPGLETKDKSGFDSVQWNSTAMEMFLTMQKGKGVGLAGPQIGLRQRIYETHIEDDIPRVFINPSIIETSQDTVKSEEGCLSVPGTWADVIRPRTVKVQAWNEKGRSFTLEAGGLLARVILHEYDHLEGILFIDRLPELKRKQILEKISKKAKT